ncbi:MAG: hypothetical protein E5W90_02045 [Mesorhizobium sp.]|nr:MAG: hypothetical protein E5W90_02045 [Mesorhizobium sp.]
MNPNAILAMTSAAFVVGVVSWALPAWKYHKHTEVGKFAFALLFAGIVFITMFKWSDIVLDVWGAKLQIKERDRKIADLQTNLSNAQIALAQVQEKAPDTDVFASNIQDAMRKAGYTVDQTTVKAIATDSLKPLKSYLESPQWFDAINPPASHSEFKGAPNIQDQMAPSNPSPIAPLVLPNKTN